MEREGCRVKTGGKEKKKIKKVRKERKRGKKHKNRREEKEKRRTGGLIDRQTAYNQTDSLQDQ
jgi:hypothetical protein